MEFRDLMKNDADFRRGFVDEFTERMTKEFTGRMTNDETILTENFEKFAYEHQKTLKSNEILKASRTYCDYLTHTESRISEFCKQRARTNPDLKPIYRKKEREASEFLMDLRDETRAAIKNIRHGNFAKRLGRSVIEDDILKTWSLVSDLLRLDFMLYFLSPWATNEFVKHTEFPSA
jgi:hypothetical protein